MKAPNYIASFACLLLAFVLFQGWMRPWKPVPGWRPHWWQSEALSNIGFILLLAAFVPAAALQSLGTTNAVFDWAVMALGFILEIGLTYVLVYYPTRYLFRCFYGIRAYRTVA